MRVIQADNGQLKVFEVNEDTAVFMGGPAELSSNRMASESMILLLDQEAYFEPDRRLNLLSQLKISPTHHYSPYEAVAAYLKSQHPAITGSIQVLDLDGDYCWPFTASFKDGCYKPGKNIAASQGLELLPLFQRVFGKDIEQMAAFDHFLASTDPKGKTYGLSVWEAIRDFENDDQSKENIIAVFDVEAWADITISQLLVVKKELLALALVDHSLPYTFVGLLAQVLSPNYQPFNCQARLLGARQLFHFGSAFFAPCSWPAYLEVFCYPDPLRIALYTAQSKFEEYTQPKKIKIFEGGNLTLYRDREPLRIGTGTKVPCWKTIEIRLDGNQKFLVNTGSHSQLV